MNTMKLAEYFGVDTESFYKRCIMLFNGNQTTNEFESEYQFYATILDDSIVDKGGFYYAEGPVDHESKLDNLTLIISVEEDDGILVKLWDQGLQLEDKIIIELEKYKHDNDHKHGIIIYPKYKDCGPACIGHINTIIKDDELAISKLCFNTLCNCCMRMMDIIKVIGNLQRGLDYENAVYFKNAKLIYHNAKKSEIIQMER